MTKIGADAFRDCEGLTGVSIPRGVEEIGCYAFEGCRGLERVVLPDSVTKLQMPFCRCENLREVALAPGNPVYTTDNRGALYREDGRVLVLCPGGVRGEFTVPEGVTELEAGAFADCTALETLDLPGSLRWIGKGALPRGTRFMRLNGLAEALWVGCEAEEEVLPGLTERLAEGGDMRSLAAIYLTQEFGDEEYLAEEALEAAPEQAAAQMRGLLEAMDTPGSRRWRKAEDFANRNGVNL